MVNALHPGVVTTKFLRKSFDMNGISIEDGAKTSVICFLHSQLMVKVENTIKTYRNTPLLIFRMIGFCRTPSGCFP